MSRWILKKPDAVHRLMRLTTDYYIELAKYWKDTFGTEKVVPTIGEPSTANNIISPKQFEHFVLPYTRELCQALLNMGYKYLHVHICGEQNLNLPYWAQIPYGNPGIISIGHEITIKTAAMYFPNDVIMGNLEPAIIQTGRPEEVYEAARQVIIEGKQISNGYIFSPGCETPPKAPIDNIKALIQAVNDHGWY
jgi:uroporphyrinogen decarboxylase